MKAPKTTFSLIALSLVLILASAASAEWIVGDASGDALLVLDVDSGELAELAPCGTPHIVSLAHNDLTGVTYCSDTSEGVNQILEIDLMTGGTTLVVQVPDFWTVIHSTAVDPADGTLYAIDQEHGDLYRVNLNSGELEIIGSIGVYWLTGADFDPTTGLLYACVGGMDDSGALYTIDTTTAAATYVTSTHRLMGIAFDDDGNLFGVNNYWYPNPPGIYSIDKSTGDWETIGEYTGRNLMSIEWVDLGIVATEGINLDQLKALYR